MPVCFLKNPSLSSLDSKFLDIAGRCVTCGLCLPHCPTYRKTLDEADSPRGRIMLMSALAGGGGLFGGSLHAHIERCLMCRACESVCPNHVPYGFLVESVRGAMYAKSPRGAKFLRGLMLRLFSMPRYFSVLLWFAHVLEVIGLRSLVRRLGVLKLLRIEAVDRVLPRYRRPPKWKRYYSTMACGRGKVGLFLGCVARNLDVETLNASIFVLNALGFVVVLPKKQGCCGEIYASQGDAELAMEMADDNIRYFSEKECTTIIVTASGCVTSLRDAAQRLVDRGRLPGLKVVEICEFLTVHEGLLAEANITSLPMRVAVHEPCTMRNSLHGQKYVDTMLRHIPGLVIDRLPGNEQCCGAAGIYHLKFPKIAGLLVDDKIAAIAASEAGAVLTTNFSCGLHMAASTKPAGISAEILHPVVLLARQMGFKG